MAFKFPGGSPVKHEKHHTAGKPVERLPLPKKLVIHTIQHIGAAAKPIVEVGEAVKKGQKIAEASAFISVPMHAPSSGTISDISEYPHPVFGKGTAIVIDTDGEDEWLEGLPTTRDIESMSVADMRNAIKNGGIVGLGGAAFPTHVKAAPPDSATIEHLLVNGAECEPYLTSDDTIMRTRAADIADGIRILLKVTGAKKAYVGIENNKPEAIAAMQTACAAIDNCDIVALPARYPQGAERSLIKAILNKWLPAGKLPMSIGIAVQNTTTCAAIADAVLRGMPLIEKLVTVSGQSITTPKNVLAPIGASWQDLLDFCGSFKNDMKRLVMGGPMMGIAQNTLDTPLVKGTSGLLALSETEACRGNEGPCLRCGKCVTVCPMGLMPLQWPTLRVFRQYDTALSEKLFDCVECGTCEYICPANRRLLQSIKVLKLRIREKQAREKAKKR